MELTREISLKQETVNDTMFQFIDNSINQFSDMQLKSLKNDLRQLNAVAYASGTRRNLKEQRESFLLFYFYFGFSFLTVSTKTLQLYAQFLSRTFKSVESIKIT